MCDTSWAGCFGGAGKAISRPQELAAASWKVTCSHGPAATAVSGGGFLPAVSSPGLLSFWGRRNRDNISGGWPCVAPLTQGRGCPQPEPHGGATGVVLCYRAHTGGVGRVSEPFTELWQPPPSTSPPHTCFGKASAGTAPHMKALRAPPEGQRFAESRKPPA